MQVRKAAENDIDRVSVLYNVLHEYLKNNINYPGWKKGIYPTRDDAEKGIAEGTLFVAECNGEIAGTVILNHEPEKGYELAKWGIECEENRVLVVHTLAVHPKFMRIGIAKTLLLFAINYARQNNLYTVRLDVYEGNLPAVRLYEELGFQYIDTVDLGYAEYNLPLFRLYEYIICDLKIVKLEKKLIKDVNRANEPFQIVGRLIPAFQNGAWEYREEIFEHPYWKSYPNDDWNYFEYIDNPEKIIFLAYIDDVCVGQIVLRKDWNKYVFIEDICVSAEKRRYGIGQALIHKAIEWTKGQGLCGLALETQDNNLLACRFYKKCGFSIGSVNTMLYQNFDSPWSDEIAVFWYIRFQEKTGEE